MDEAQRSALVAQYAAGAAEIDSAVRQVLAAGLLDTTPPDGGWTPRMVVHHLADSETRAAVRLRQLLAEDVPTIHGYDEEGYAKALHYDRSIEVSLALVTAVRAASLELVRLLEPADFARTGTHTETGAYSVDTWLATYAAHAQDHSTQIRSVLAY